MTGLHENWNFKCVSTILGHRSPVLNFLNFFSSQVLLSYKPLSHKQDTCIVSYCNDLEGGFVRDGPNSHRVYIIFT